MLRDSATLCYLDRMFHFIQIMMTMRLCLYALFYRQLIETVLFQVSQNVQANFAVGTHVHCRYLSLYLSHCLYYTFTFIYYFDLKVLSGKVGT